MARKFGWNSGYMEALNLQGGTISFTSGQTTASVTFDDAMDNSPAVVLTNSEDDLMFIDTRSSTSFTAKRGSTGGAVTVSWIAFDDNGA